MRDPRLARPSRVFVPATEAAYATRYGAKDAARRRVAPAGTKHALHDSDLSVATDAHLLGNSFEAKDVGTLHRAKLLRGEQRIPHISRQHNADGAKGANAKHAQGAISSATGSDGECH